MRKLHHIQSLEWLSPDQSKLVPVGSGSSSPVNSYLIASSVRFLRNSVGGMPLNCRNIRENK
jgi:hypothetical protein